MVHVKRVVVVVLVFAVTVAVVFVGTWLAPRKVYSIVTEIQINHKYPLSYENEKRWGELDQWKKWLMIYDDETWGMVNDEVKILLDATHCLGSVVPDKIRMGMNRSGPWTGHFYIGASPYYDSVVEYDDESEQCRVDEWALKKAIANEEGAKARNAGAGPMSQPVVTPPGPTL